MVLVCIGLAEEEEYRALPLQIMETVEMVVLAEAVAVETWHTLVAFQQEQVEDLQLIAVAMEHYQQIPHSLML
jgi:hypothetical protein